MQFETERFYSLCEWGTERKFCQFPPTLGSSRRWTKRTESEISMMANRYAKKKIGRKLKDMTVVAVTLVIAWRLLLAWDWFAVKVTVDQSRLARIAMTSEDEAVRKVAVKKLTDQPLLAKIAMEDDDIGIRYAAIDNLKDQALLARVARTVYVRDDVVKNGIRYGETENEVFFRKAAVVNLSDQTLLAQIAVEGGDSDVGGRLAAVEKLEDQALLARIAVEAEYADVRRSAIDKLSDQKLLTRIALEDRSCPCHMAAVRRLSDQALLARIALDYQNGSCCLAAVERLSDPVLLAKVAIEAGTHQSESNVCVSSFRVGSDHEIELEHERKRGGVRAAAVDKLSDQPLLAKVAMENMAADSSVRISAVQKLSDPTLLAKVSVEADCRDTRASAYRKLHELFPDINALRASTEDAQTRLYTTIVGNIQKSKIPEEHRERWYLNLSEIVPILFVPAVVDQLGSLKDFQIEWKPCSAQYSTGVIRGEEVTLSVNLSKEGSPLRHVWWTDFPYGITYTNEPPKWLSAAVSSSAFYSEHLLRLPQSAHERIAQESKGGEVREAAAVAALSDQNLLAKTALEARSTGVRKIAVQKLEDQAALAKVAVGMRYLDWSLREVVVKKLEDQAALAKVAVQDESGDIRYAAVRKLKDEELLTRIAEEDKDLVVRHAAKERLDTRVEMRNETQSKERKNP